MIFFEVFPHERDALSARFWSHVSRRGDGCWEFSANHEGYRNFYVRGGRAAPLVKKAHQVSFALSFGPVTNEILHSCDNKKCARPDHLPVGSHQSNIDDKLRKGRQTRGSSHGTSKLDEATVGSIRCLLASGRHQDDVAKLFGVSQADIHKIATGKTWRHVK